MQEMTLNGKLLEKRCGLISGKEKQNNEENIDCDTILNNYVTINDGVIRHNVEKLSLDIYSYLVNE